MVEYSKGKSSITINIENIYNKSNIFKSILLFFISPLLFILISPYIIFRCIIDRNIHFKYLFIYKRIPKEYRNDISHDYFELKLVFLLLFYIGIHKYFKKYSKNNKYLNINIYQNAYYFRKKIIDNYTWRYKS